MQGVIQTSVLYVYFTGNTSCVPISTTSIAVEGPNGKLNNLQCSLFRDILGQLALIIYHIYSTAEKNLSSPIQFEFAIV